MVPTLRKIQTFPPPTKCWVQTQLLIISIFRMGCCVVWAISVFHKASEKRLIWEAHYSRVAGHFDVKKTVAMLQKHFYWTKLRQEVNKYIKSCTAFDISKLTTKKQGLYTPLPNPDRPWESISMDYMSGLSSTKWGNDYVFVVLDRFSKMAILVACKKNIIVEATAKLFFERVWVHFGIPQTIVLNRDSRFLRHSGRASGDCWTPSSPNPRPSTPRQMAKSRS
jgi:hypothetical protein